MNSAISKNSKISRQQNLRRILAENQISAQEEVVERMLLDGFQVTQSSISRDFKELGVAKIDGNYRVASADLRFRLGKFVLSSESAGDNMLVVRTVSGGASAVAEAIDHEHIVGVVGTIAGDNTIMIATKNVQSHQAITEFVSQL